MKINLDNYDGTVVLEELENNSFRINVKSKDGYYAPITELDPNIR